MKQLTCEMCGSIDLVKNEGVFICQNCGTKYSVEEAKKMMIEGTVDVQGIVKIDASDDLKKLYQAARNARETSDDETALRHYESISAKDPDSWEAMFYLVVLKTNSIKNSEIASAAVSVINSLDRVFQLINKNITDETEKKNAVKEITEQCYDTATWLASASENFYKTMTKGNGVMALTGIGGIISSVSSTSNALTENKNRFVRIANIMCVCGNAIEIYCDMEDDDYKEYAAWSWEKFVEIDNTHYTSHFSHVFDDETLAKYKNKSSSLNPTTETTATSTSANNSETENSSVTTPPINSKTEDTKNSGGCYVATAVYGSYDCPQVWTLRRFRDYTLAETRRGRAFIKTYYAISPTLVKWFGHTNWFKRLWKKRLDKMVAQLQSKGVENTPYEDKNW